MPPKIEDYRFGSITIDGKQYKEDVIIFPQGVKDGWWRKEGHSLDPADLDEVIKDKPEIFIVGCGANGLDPADLDEVIKDKPEIFIVGCGANGAMKVPDSTRKWLENQGIELQAMPSGEACKTYNELAGNKKVAAGLHLTC